MTPTRKCAIGDHTTSMSRPSSAFIVGSLSKRSWTNYSPASNQTTSPPSLTSCDQSDSSVAYDTPIKVTIPVPSEIPRARGPNSTSQYGGNLRVRCSNQEYDLVFDEAAMLGVTPSNFCRWSIVQTALAVQEHRLSKSKSDTAEKKEK